MQKRLSVSTAPDRLVREARLIEGWQHFIWSRVRLVAVVLASGLLSPLAFPADNSNVSIATLIPGPPECPVDMSAAATKVFVQGIEDGGYVGHWKQYCYAALADVPIRVRQILDSKPSILLIFGSVVAARAVKDANSDVPVVFVDVADPVKNGLVKSLASPTWNMTGITNVTDELVAKRTQLLKEALPALTRLAVLGNLTNPEQSSYLHVVQEAARALRIDARLYPVESQAQLAGAFDQMERDGMQAVLLLPDAWFFPNRSEIIALAARHRIPAMYHNTAYADIGGLFVYGANLSDMTMKAVSYMEKILKGAKPGDLPVSRPERFDFIVNAKTAREEGVQLTSATRLRATQITE